MTLDKTLHVKRRRATAKEDFGIEDELPPKEKAAPAQNHFFQKHATPWESIEILDVLAALASIGVAQRVNDPAAVAIESYAIAQEMIKRIEF